MISSTTYQCWWRRGGRWRRWSRRRPLPGRSRTPSSASSTLPSWPGGSLNNMDSFEQITRNQPRCTRRRASQRRRRRGRQWPTRQWTSLWRSARLAPEHQLYHRHPDNHNHNHNPPSVHYHHFWCQYEGLFLCLFLTTLATERMTRTFPKTTTIQRKRRRSAE